MSTALEVISLQMPPRSEEQRRNQLVFESCVLADGNLWMKNTEESNYIGDVSRREAGGQ